VETTVESMLLKWQTKLLPTYNNRANNRANANHYRLLACSWDYHPLILIHKEDQVE
jgi:hypothetical protein